MLYHSEGRHERIESESGAIKHFRSKHNIIEEPIRLDKKRFIDVLTIIGEDIFLDDRRMEPIIPKKEEEKIALAVRIKPIGSYWYKRREGWIGLLSGRLARTVMETSVQP